jgi:hypothetical protein
MFSRPLEGVFVLDISFARLSRSPSSMARFFDSLVSGGEESSRSV